MELLAQTKIVLFTWLLLLFIYLINRYVGKNKCVNSVHIIQIGNQDEVNTKPGTTFSKMGVLFVFMANIATFTMVFVFTAAPDMDQNWRILHVNLPVWINYLGCFLFIINAIWGTLVLVFNPNYTPLTRRMRRQFFLATEGPYALIRHPRYASEAMLNIVLFLFTGIWIPLLGIVGWAAIYYQARAEEKCLLALAGVKYLQYQRKTGFFFPRL